MVEDNKVENTIPSEETDATITEKAAPEDVFENDGSSVEKPEKKSFWNENKVEIIVAILLGAIDPVRAFVPGLGDIWDIFPKIVMGIITAITIISGIDYFVSSKHILKKFV